MNPKDMTNEVLLDVWLKEMKGDYEHGCPCETEVNCRLDEADALRKENKELRKESFALYARLNEYSYQFIYGGRSGVRTAYVLAAPVLASYRLSHPDGFDAKEIEARS